jgi:hypothetical protein
MDELDLRSRSVTLQAAFLREVRDESRRRWSFISITNTSEDRDETW